jgi:hypothetical protein
MQKAQDSGECYTLFRLLLTSRMPPLANGPASDPNTTPSQYQYCVIDKVESAALNASTGVPFRLASAQALALTSLRGCNGLLSHARDESRAYKNLSMRANITAHESPGLATSFYSYKQVKRTTSLPRKPFSPSLLSVPGLYCRTDLKPMARMTPQPHLQWASRVLWLQVWYDGKMSVCLPTFYHPCA